MPGLDEYAPIIGRSLVDELRLLAERVGHRRVRCVNATRVGGGVAEILQRMVPLCNELGLDVRWDVLEGHEPFYRVTKKFHNALHGRSESLTPAMFDLFLAVNEANRARLALDGDLCFIHDPQPVALVQGRAAAGARWIWRCHIDLTHAQPQVWDFLRPFVLQYDAAVYSAPAFAHQLPMRQLLIAPSIDPLSDKNRMLDAATITQVLGRLGVPQDLPLVTQVSRFDYLKDPLGVIAAFRKVRKSFKCRLLLAGGSADDDPEGAEVLAQVLTEAHGDPAIHVLLLPPNSDLEINALQRASAVIVQKSLREGFGLTVAEGLWKARPVVASAVGGIPLQIKHGYGGLLVHSIDGAANAIKEYLRHPDYAKQLGVNGQEHVRQHFLLTRHLRDYLLMFLTVGMAEETVRLA